MEINNIFELFFYFIFTLAAIIGGLFMGIFSIISGLRLFFQYGCKRVPTNTFISGFGKNAVEIIFVGLLSLGGAIWYLFIDREGHLFNLIAELSKLMD